MCRASSSFVFFFLFFYLNKKARSNLFRLTHRTSHFLGFFFFFFFLGGGGGGGLGGRGGGFAKLGERAYLSSICTLAIRSTDSGPLWGTLLSKR